MFLTWRTCWPRTKRVIRSIFPLPPSFGGSRPKSISRSGNCAVQAELLARMEHVQEAADKVIQDGASPIAGAVVKSAGWCCWRIILN